MEVQKTYEDLVNHLLLHKGAVGIYAGYEHVTSLTEKLIRLGEIISTVKISRIPEDSVHDEYYLTVDGDGVFCVPAWNAQENRYHQIWGYDPESFVHVCCSYDLLKVVYSPLATIFSIVGEDE